MTMREYLKKNGTHSLALVVRAALVRANPEFAQQEPALNAVVNEMLDDVTSALEQVSELLVASSGHNL